MWTYRLRLHLVGGPVKDLYGPEEALVRFRDMLAPALERGDHQILTYLARSQAVTVHVDRVERIGDLEPVIARPAARPVAGD